MTLSPKYSSSHQRFQSHRSLQDHNTPPFPASPWASPRHLAVMILGWQSHRHPSTPWLLVPPMRQPPGRGQRRPSAALSATPMARRPLCAASQCPPRPLLSPCRQAACWKPPGQPHPGHCAHPGLPHAPWEVVAWWWVRQRCPRLTWTRAHPMARRQLAGPPIWLLATTLTEAMVLPSSGAAVLNAEATSPAALHELSATEICPGTRPLVGKAEPQGFEALGWQRTSRPEPPGGRRPTLAARMAAGGLRRPLGVVAGG